MEFLTLEGVGFAYSRNSPLLRDISFSLRADDTVALMGPNGSGKTTLGKIMVGILPVSAGRIRLDKQDIAAYRLSEIGRRIGYVFQNPAKQLFCSSAAEEVSFGLAGRGWTAAAARERSRELLEQFELTHCAQEFPLNLSRGEQQRLAIAAALALEPKFLILDEPTTGLDKVRKQILAETLLRLRESGVGYLLISHDAAFCRQCTGRTLFLREGGSHWRESK